jgi:anaphase-promoting complex subunit 6
MKDSIDNSTKLIRSMIQDLMAKHQYKGAMYYASKLVIMSNFAPKDMFLLANSLFLDSQYHRCYELLDSRGLVHVDVRFRLLAAQCLVAQNLWEECVALLDDCGASGVSNLPYACGGEKMASALCAILGKAYGQLENFKKSTLWLREALAQDPFNAEAFTLLLESCRLNEEEELALVEEVASTLPENAEWLKNLYWSMCRGRGVESSGRVKGALESLSCSTKASGGAAANKVTTRSSSRNEKQPFACSLPHPLSQDGDVVSARATMLINRGRFSEAYGMTKSVLDRELYNTRLLPLHLSIAVKLKKKNDIFVLGHKLMDRNPDAAESWFAAGCYYYVTEQYSSARNFFGKATTINKLFAPAWIAYAHSFACMDETDQAMAAYRTAARLFPGLYQPVLGMALEYSRMNNMALAEKMCRLAHHKCPNDPFLLHEMGTMAFKNGRYKEARSLLEEAVNEFDVVDEDREVALVNLGHVYRKLSLYGMSIAVLEKALVLQPYQAGTHSAIAYAYQLAGDPMQAVEAYHKALSLRPEDPFAINMLETALKDSEHLTLDMLEVSSGDRMTE